MILKTRSDFGKFLKERGQLDHAAEVGVAEGRYSLEMCEWGIKKLYLVDLWQSIPGAGPHGDLDHPQATHDGRFTDCMGKIEPYRERVVVLRGWSHEMAKQIPDGSLGFVHLDATHTADAVARDLDAYWPKLRPGGIMSGHDYLSPIYTVRQGVDQWAADRGLTVHAIDTDRPNDACFWMEKP